VCVKLNLNTIRGAEMGSQESLTNLTVWGERCKRCADLALPCVCDLMTRK
jgi:hypothetical protein